MPRSKLLKHLHTGNCGLPRNFKADSSVDRVVMTGDEGLSPFIR